MCVWIQPAVLLSSMNTGAVCELVKQIDGIDTTMLPQYTTIIKKVGLFIDNPMLVLLHCSSYFSFHFPVQANVNGRVLSQCNLDDLKKEMEMNFGDWQLFRNMVRLLWGL